MDIKDEQKRHFPYNLLFPIWNIVCNKFKFKLLEWTIYKIPRKYEISEKLQRTLYM